MFRNNTRSRRVGKIDLCKKCGQDYTVATPSQKYCPDCQYPRAFLDPRVLPKAEREIKKRLMEISNVKIYGSSSYRPPELERSYFERKDPLFLERLVSRESIHNN
jgi:hypothetical protein